VLERVNSIIKLITQGWTSPKIIEYVSNPSNELGWHVSNKQAVAYMKKAYKGLKETNILDRQFYLNESLSRLTYLYENAIANEHYQFASEIESKKQDLLSLKEYHNKEFVQNIAGVVDFRFEAIDATKYKDGMSKDSEK